MVNKGIWRLSGEGTAQGEDAAPGLDRGTEVAVKVLPTQTAEEERVKLLQEAAVMGQFRHPNVLSILGVITCEDPVRNPLLYAYT